MHVAIQRHYYGSNYRATYPINAVDLVLVVPDESSNSAEAYAQTVVWSYAIYALMFLNAIVRKCGAHLRNRDEAHSILYYFFDTFRLIHGNPSKTFLHNAAEYISRVSLSFFSTIYSATLCLLYLQYVYDLNQPEFDSVADVERHQLPLYCSTRYSPTFSPRLLPYEVICKTTFGERQPSEVDIAPILDWMRERRRLAFFSTVDHVRDMLKVLYENESLKRAPYRVLSRPIRQQYQMAQASQFDQNVSLYELYMRRADEHGFLRYFRERNRRIHYDLYMIEQQAIGRDRDVRLQIYRQLRLEDLQMVFETLAFMLAFGVVIWLLEFLVFEGRRRGVLKRVKFWGV